MAKRSRIRVFSEEDKKSIAIVARNIMMQEGFSQSDLEDVKQQLYWGLYRESRNYRSRKSDWKTFRWEILAQIAGRIKREQMQPSNRYMNAPTISLNQPVANDGDALDDYPTMMDWVTGNHIFVNEDKTDETDRHGVVIDVRAFLETLPAPLKNICNEICIYGIIVARKNLKMPHSTFFRRIAEIRRRMINAGLDVYLKK